jgi:hypothetical protein
MAVPLVEVCLVPIVTNKSGDITRQENYRPIALATVASKLLEILILHLDVKKSCVQQMLSSDLNLIIPLKRVYMY